QNAAAAKALEQQSQAMDERVSFFRLGEEEAARAGAAERPVAQASRPHAPAAAKHHSAAAPAHRAAMPEPRPAATRRPVARMQAALATAIKDDADWKEF